MSRIALFVICCDRKTKKEGNTLAKEKIKKEKPKKPKYNMWQNSCWMIGTAWKIKEKKVIFICLAQVIIALGQSLVSLFISPAVISAVETQKSLTYLLVTILVFIGATMLLNCANSYVFVCLNAWAGAFGVGEITQYIGALTMVSGAIGTMITSLNELRNNAEFLKLTFDFLDIPNKMYQGSLTVEKRMDNDYEIEFRDVSFKYPGSENYALRHVSFKFNIGEKLAVVGQNGSGKTTFIKLLCRLYDPDEGEILLNGINIRKYNYLDYISVFSVVFQDFRLFALPLGQNVAINSSYDAEKVNSCLEKAGFILDAEKMPQGLDTYLYKNLDKNGVNVSGGEAQKIAIARALYKNAPFIILDEPTAALDPVAESEIYSRFSEMVTDRTAVYISHRLSSCRFCDKIAVFDHGSVVQVGTHDGLLSDESGKYYELWNAQAQYYDEKE